MIYPEDEVADGMERLGRYPEARYLKQLLLKAVLELPAGNAMPGAVRLNLGRRILASELIDKLKFEPQKNDAGPDATELLRRPARERAEPESRRLARRNAASDDNGDPRF